MTEYRPWSRDDDDFLRRNGSMGSRFCAGHLGRTVWAVRNRARQIGASLSSPKRGIAGFMLSVEYDTVGGCWLWAKANTGRYGALNVGGKMGLAHRRSWELFKGPIPDGRIVCHACDVPLCVNPDHLWLGTDKDNALDKVRKGRDPRATLSAEQARSIASDGRPTLVIAKDYGVGVHVVRNLRNGRNYSEATGLQQTFSAPISAEVKAAAEAKNARIAAAIMAGDSFAAIARREGVTRTTIYHYEKKLGPTARARRETQA